MEQETEQTSQIYKVGEKYTVIAVSDSFAMTNKTEIKVKEVKEDGSPIFTLAPRGRKLKQLMGNGRTDHLVFHGWDIELKIDSEAKQIEVGQGLLGGVIMCGNACYNFLGTPEFVKNYIEKYNLNGYFNRYDSILAHGERVTDNDESAEPVYPETPTTHAVVLRIREKKGGNKAPEVVSTYTESQAIEDGVLTKNPRSDVWSECDIVTGNLIDELKVICNKRNETRVFPQEPLELLACMLNYAKDIYTNEKFVDDNDKNFFVVPKGENMTKDIWFVRNENAKLTAMLPEDY